MSYRDAQYPGQENSGSEQYWTKEDFIENDRSYEVVQRLETARKEYPFLADLDSSEKYQSELKDYAERCGVTVEQLLSYHRTGEMNLSKSDKRALPCERDLKECDGAYGANGGKEPVNATGQGDFPRLCKDCALEAQSMRQDLNEQYSHY